MSKNFENKNILVTGGTGYIGKRLIKTLLTKRPNIIRILDNNEEELFNIEQELSNGKLRYFLGDIKEKERVERALENVDIVFHMASLKHVYICEYNPFEAIKTNVLGLQNIIDAALNNEVDKFIFSSSDKAVNPTNTMGTTKLLGEKLVVAANYYSGAHKTKFSCVRFGNVLGSSGSLVPVIKNQLYNKKAITLTHKDMTRFAMSMEDVMLLLLKSVEMMVGGEIFIKKMLRIKIKDLIEVMVENFIEKNKFCQTHKIETIGIKPGEKLYEELMTIEETSRAIEWNDFYIITPQIKKYLKIDYKNSYKGSKDVKVKEYRSDKGKLCSKEEIKETFGKISLLEV